MNKEKPIQIDYAAAVERAEHKLQPVRCYAAFCRARKELQEQLTSAEVQCHILESLMRKNPKLYKRSQYELVLCFGNATPDDTPEGYESKASDFSVVLTRRITEYVGFTSCPEISFAIPVDVDVDFGPAGAYIAQYVRCRRQQNKMTPLSPDDSWDYYDVGTDPRNTRLDLDKPLALGRPDDAGETACICMLVNRVDLSGHNFALADIWDNYFVSDLDIRKDDEEETDSN